jgi:hypothetical protein
VWVTFPLMAGTEVGWPRERTYLAIFVMTFCSVIGWVAVIATWLIARRDMRERQNPQDTVKGQVE